MLSELARSEFHFLSYSVIFIKYLKPFSEISTPQKLKDRQHVSLVARDTNLDLAISQLSPVIAGSQLMQSQKLRRSEYQTTRRSDLQISVDSEIRRPRVQDSLPLPDLQLSCFEESRTSKLPDCQTMPHSKTPLSSEKRPSKHFQSKDSLENSRFSAKPQKALSRSNRSHSQASSPGDSRSRSRTPLSEKSRGRSRSSNSSPSSLRSGRKSRSKTTLDLPLGSPGVSINQSFCRNRSRSRTPFNSPREYPEVSRSKSQLLLRKRLPSRTPLNSPLSSAGGSIPQNLSHSINPSRSPVASSGGLGHDKTIQKQCAKNCRTKKPGPRSITQPNPVISLSERQPGQLTESQQVPSTQKPSRRPGPRSQTQQVSSTGTSSRQRDERSSFQEDANQSSEVPAASGGRYRRRKNLTLRFTANSTLTTLFIIIILLDLSVCSVWRPVPEWRPGTRSPLATAWRRPDDILRLTPAVLR
ncbi:peptidyl-prolyl cis-trans isomerase CYP95-like isoform X1 [Nasonia vitripennis]|uniref:Uncharacterized protein n=1 Tax=Nasonia vitripennis TaxID=7425 RepID=A0A7M7QKZ2_NASVI|nr:peptidyl-prolyl cis-trans isomerase CYP95-like isoform X1 [Nasonia vitripennis]